MDYHVYWSLKSFCFEYFGDGKWYFFESKSWWKDYIYRLLKSSCFEPFWNGKYSLFWAEMQMERWYLLITEKVLVLNFSVMRKSVFFSQKVRGKMIFSWSFLVFHDIPGLGKYGFSYSVNGSSLQNWILNSELYFYLNIKNLLLQNIFNPFHINFAAR